MRKRKLPRTGRKVGAEKRPAGRIARPGRGRTPTLLAIRRRRGLTVVQVARRAGLDPATVWRIETGVYTPPPDTLKRLRQALSS